jgi:flagellar biosynthesis component FlhA
MDDVLEVVAQCAFETPSDRARLSDHVRESLAPMWLPQLLDALARLGAPRTLRFSADAEAELVARWVVGATGARLGFTADQRVRWVAALGRAADAETGLGPVIVLSAPAARAAIAELTRRITPHVTVLSVAELDVAGVTRPTVRWIEIDWLASA